MPVGRNKGEGGADVKRGSREEQLMEGNYMGLCGIIGRPLLFPSRINQIEFLVLAGQETPKQTNPIPPLTTTRISWELIG